MLWLHLLDVVLKRDVPVLRWHVAKTENAFAMEVAARAIIVAVLKKNVAQNVTAISSFF
jgi:hypothetical protein